MATKATKTGTKAAKLLRDALKLPEADRADIASCLYGSLNSDIELHPAWGKEIERRIREVEEGKVKPIPRKEAERLIFGDAKRIRGVSTIRRSALHSVVRRLRRGVR